MHCAIDESAYSASKAYGSISELDSLPKIRRRILQENELLYSLKIRNVADNYSDGSSDGLTRYSVHAKMAISLPAGFDRSLDFTGRIKYRGFKGLKYAPRGMGTAGLESEEPEDFCSVVIKQGLCSTKFINLAFLEFRKYRHQPFYYYLHMKKAQKTAPEAESKGC